MFCPLYRLHIWNYLNQESSEKSLIEIIKEDKELQNYLEEDDVLTDDLNNYSNFHILENNLQNSVQIDWTVYCILAIYGFTHIL